MTPRPVKALRLAVQPRRKSGAAGQILVRLQLDHEFYALEDAIDLLDEAIYHEAELTLLLVDQSEFTLVPTRYGAISVVAVCS